MSKHKSGIPKFLLSAAERSQVLEDSPLAHLYRAARRLVTGSNSRAFVPIRYGLASGINYFSSSEVVAEANPDAGFLPRSWKRAFVMGVGKWAIDLTTEHILDFDVNGNPQPAVGYAAADGWHSGILPKFGELETPNDPGNYKYAVAMRLGRSSFNATLGLQDSRGILWVPEGVHIIDSSIPTAELESKYPGVPLV